MYINNSTLGLLFFFGLGVSAICSETSSMSSSVSSAVTVALGFFLLGCGGISLKERLVSVSASLCGSERAEFGGRGREGTLLGVSLSVASVVGGFFFFLRGVRSTEVISPSLVPRGGNLPLRGTSSESDMFNNEKFVVLKLSQKCGSSEITTKKRIAEEFQA